MESLMDLCRSWGNADCHPDVSEFRYAKERKEGEEISFEMSIRKREKVIKSYKKREGQKRRLRPNLIILAPEREVIFL